MSCELTTNTWTGRSQSASHTPHSLLATLLRSMGKGRKRWKRFKTEKSFNAIPTLSKTPTYLSPVCGL